MEFAEVADPSPDDGEILIEVEAFSVNRGETFLLETPRPGWRPGQDIAGTVRASSSGRFAVGTRVLALADSAGWAARATVPSRQAAVLPDRVDTAVAASLPLAGVTALRLVRAAGALIGRRVLLTGASGGVGHFLTELAASAGAEVTAVSATAERGQRLRNLGADTVVTSIDEAEGPYDVVFESVGGPVLRAALERTAPAGHVLWYGGAGGEPLSIDFFEFFGGQESVRLEHFYYETSGPPADNDLETLVRLVAADRLHPEIGREADWSETAEVLEELRGRRIRGKAVLHVPQG